MTPEQFKTARKSLGLTQQALADRWGLSEQTIKNYEHGRTEVKFWVVDAFLGLSIVVAKIMEGE